MKEKQNDQRVQILRARGNVYIHTRVLEVRNFWFTTTNTRATALRSGTVEKFSGDQERSISTIRYFVSSAVRVRGRPYKKSLRGESFAVSASEGGKGGGREGGESLEGYPPAVPRDSDSFSSRKTGYWYCSANFSGTFLPAAGVLLEHGDKNIFARARDVNNLRRRSRNVCHYCRARRYAPHPKTHSLRCAIRTRISQNPDLSSVLLIAGTRRRILASRQTSICFSVERTSVYIFIIRLIAFCILRRVCRELCLRLKKILDSLWDLVSEKLFLSWDVEAVILIS